MNENGKKCCEANVGHSERYISGAIGALLLTRSFKGGGLSGLIEGVAGATMLYRAASGQCCLYKALGINTCSDSKSENQCRTMQTT